jgi:hypothetical protein
MLRHGALNDGQKSNERRGEREEHEELEIDGGAANPAWPFFRIRLCVLGRGEPPRTPRD